jgi:hypothetical protein
MAFYPYTYSQVRVPAGTRQIMVLIESAEFQAAGELYYRVFNSLPSIDYTVNPSTAGYTAISSNNLINVTNNQYVVFSALGKNTSPVSTKVTVVSMPDFSVIGSFTINIQTVAGGDVTPNPSPNWCNISCDIIGTTFIYATDQITGITTPITLRLSGNVSAFAELYYYRDTNPFPVANCGSDSLDPSSYGMLNIYDNDTFTVNPDEYVTFAILNTSLTTGSAQIQIINTSDGNVVLDTFDAAITM